MGSLHKKAYEIFLFPKESLLDVLPKENLLDIIYNKNIY